MQRPISRHSVARGSLEHTALNGISSLNPSSQGSGNPSGRGGRKNVKASEDGGHQENSKSTEQNSYELTETGVASTGPTQSAPDPLHSFQLSVFMGLLSVRISISLILVPALGALFLVGLSCLTSM